MIRTAVSLLAAVQLVAADVYMHMPRGSNNKWCERNQNRNNANRLFDSQNNAAGGYHCAGDQTIAEGDPLTFYTGSHLRMEWTNQHACGPNSNVQCQMIIQAACGGDDMFEGLRDPVGSGEIIDAANGGTTGQYFKREFLFNNEQGTNTIPLPADIPAEVLPTLAEGDDGEDNAEYQQAISDFYAGNPDTVAGLAGREYGLVESFEYYEDCLNRERNKGLWAADENLNANRNSAKYTRQDSSGNRYGLECPEERDFYPYHGATQFRDIAILTSEVSHCEYYQSRSQNVQSRWFCDCDEECQAAAGGVAPIEEEFCEQSNGIWTEVPAFDILPPDCGPHPYTADNHLGHATPVNENDETVLEAGAPEFAHYDWVVPQWMEDRTCLIRMRYNISTNDNMAFQYLSDDGEFTDANYNCPINTQQEAGMADGENRCFCRNEILEDCVPLYNDPYVTNWPESDDTYELSIAMNADQHGRTFQDRSFTFKVGARPDDIPADATIWNLNVRGRRGNIVQAYPAVEYFFSPSTLNVERGDYIVYNVHNSWFNNGNTAGNGNNNMDASNLVEIPDSGSNFPTHYSQLAFFDDETARELAFPPFAPSAQGDYSECGLECCVTYYEHEVVGENDDDFNQQIYNCGKLNHMPATWQPNFQVTADAGEYSFVSTRNNDFTNRSQKMTILVSPNLSTAAIAGIAIASIAVVGAAAGFGVYKFKTRAVSGASSV